MNNQELERKIKEIISTENFFDAAELAAEFNKDYKKTSFFKKTRMPLADVIKNAKMWYLLDLGSLFNSIQEKIGELDLSNIEDILNQLGNVFSDENGEILNMIKEVRDIDLFK